MMLMTKIMEEDCKKTTRRCKKTVTRLEEDSEDNEEEKERRDVVRESLHCCSRHMMNLSPDFTSQEQEECEVDLNQENDDEDRV